MTDNDRLTRMITQQLAIQEIIDNNAKKSRISDMTVDERIEFIRYNYIALVQELSEFMNEVSWKSWSNATYLNEREAFGELRDTFQFLINLMLATTLDAPSDLAARLERDLYEKQARNLERAAMKYDDRIGKCPSCKRDIGDVITNEIYNTDGSIDHIRCMCGQELKEAETT